MNTIIINGLLYAAIGIGLSLALAGCGSDSGPKPADKPEAGEMKSHFQLASEPAKGWQRIATAQGGASVEFPISSSMVETVGDPSGSSPQVFSLSGDVTNKSINLRFSYSRIPAEWAQLAETQQLEQVVASFKQSGFGVSAVGPVPGQAGVFQIVADKNGNEQRFVVRVAFLKGFIYRAVATSIAGFHDDPDVMTFINSFKCGL